VTDNITGDAPLLPCLLTQIPADDKIASVSGDGAYGTKGSHEAIAQNVGQSSPLARTPSNGKTSVPVQGP
jgi:hypothetical protein